MLKIAHIVKTNFFIPYNNKQPLIFPKVVKSSSWKNHCYGNRFL